MLYEKDPVESLEELLVDKERPGLRYKLTQAIKGAYTRELKNVFFSRVPSRGPPSLTQPSMLPSRDSPHPPRSTSLFFTAAANEACKNGATVECAAAWEEVDGLEDGRCISL